MPEQATSFVQESKERFNSARERIDGEVERIQKQLRTRSERIEQQLSRRRKSFEKQTERRVKKFEKTPLGKRISNFRTNAQKQYESNVESFLRLFPVASSAEIKRLERKVTSLTRKVNALEKEKA